MVGSGGWKSVGTLAVLCLALGCDDGSAGGGEEPLRRDMKVRQIADSAQPSPDGGEDSGLPVDVDRGVAPDGGLDQDQGAPPDVAAGCQEGETRPCPGGGVQECKDGTWTLCEMGGGDELCNAVDDDADGTIDEGFAGLGTECTEVVDGCNQAGIFVCTADGMGVRCLTQGDGPQPEACDGIDNDCDNAVDEDFPGRRCCTEDVHCPVGAQCQGGQCTEPPAPECMSPLDCPPGQQCVNGMCDDSPPPGGCVDDGDCPQGQMCQFGFCVAGPGGPCADDFDCVGFELCFDGMCRDPVPGECRDDFDCFGDACIDGMCQQGPCIDNFDCGIFEICLEGMCQEPPPGACLNNFDCPGGALCIDNMCVEGACRGDFDCPDGQLCEGDMCVPGDCRDDFQCGRLERCVENQCSDAPRGEANCMEAVELDGFGAYEANTAGRADEHLAQCVPVATGGEAVFTFQLDRPADVRLDTRGSPFDTVLSVRTECGAVGSEVACNDDAAGGGSAVAFEAAADTRYWVLVDGFRGASGPVVLNFDGDVACVEDADCDGVCVGGRCRPPLSCDAPIPVEAFGEFRGRTAGRPDDVVPVCGGAGAGELVYSLQFERDTPVRIDTRGSDYDTLIALRTACADPASEVGCNDDGAGAGSPSALSFLARADTPYFLIVDGYRGAVGSAVVNISGPPERDPAVPDCADCAGRCVQDVCVAAVPDACGHAVDFTGWAGMAGDTVGQESRFVPSCTPIAQAPDQLVLFALPYAGRVRIDTNGSAFDTVLSVLGADCEGVLACDDDGGEGNRSQVELEVAAGTPYYLVVDGYGVGASGAFRLNFSWLE